MQLPGYPPGVLGYSAVNNVAYSDLGFDLAIFDKRLWTGVAVGLVAGFVVGKFVL